MHLASTPEENEGLLLQRCQRGEREAIRELYDAHARWVMAIARRLGLPEPEVEDVAQEVFSTAFGNLSRVQPGGLAPWLFRLVSNRVNDRHRRRRVREAFARLFGRFEETSVQDDPERELLRIDAKERVARILRRMTHKKRDVFVLYELEGLAGEEIAERLRIPLDTVWTRLHHARKEFARLGRGLELFEQAREGRGALP